MHLREIAFLVRRTQTARPFPVFWYDLSSDAREKKKGEKEKRILPEFHRNVQEMTNCLDILRKSASKIRKMLEISGICEKFSFFISFFHSSP